MSSTLMVTSSSWAARRAPSATSSRTLQARVGAPRVFVVPEFDLVMVMRAGLYQSPLQGEMLQEILNR